MARDTDPVSVTVVIPCFDAEDSIEAAIESVLFQSGVGFEIVCVNDGSRDSTGPLLAAFADEGVISYIDHADRQGASVARNRGLEVACGEFTQFLDADDTLLQGKLQRQVDVMRTSGVEMVAGAYEHINRVGHRSVHYPDEDLWGGLLASRLGRTSSNMFRTTALHAVGGWKEGQISSQEYDLMFRLLKDGARVVIDNIVGTRLSGTLGSISNDDVEGNALRFIQLRREMTDYLKRAGLLTDYRRECYDTIHRQTRQLLSNPSDI